MISTTLDPISNSGPARSTLSPVSVQKRVRPAGSRLPSPTTMAGATDSGSWGHQTICSKLRGKQGELWPLERGMHALHSGMDVKAYAASVGQGKERITVQHEVMAAHVAGAVFNVEHGDFALHYMKLVEIHATPDSLAKREPKSPMIASPGV